MSKVHHSCDSRVSRSLMKQLGELGYVYKGGLYKCIFKSICAVDVQANCKAPLAFMIVWLPFEGLPAPINVRYARPEKCI